MRILAIETATDRCGVALRADGALIAELLLTRPRSHAENLVPMISDALRLAGLAAREIDAVAVSMGPGSYTGLRIGVSTAKGFAFASDAQLVGVPSLQALALAAGQDAVPGSEILTVFAARREEVYLALWERTTEGDDGFSSILARTDVEAVPISEIANHLPERDTPLILAGDGAQTVFTAVANTHVTRMRSVRISRVLPHAGSVARLGEDLLRLRGNDDLASFEPFYLKEFVAKQPKQTIFDRLPF